ncbi:MAG TPA: N-acetyltransferase [Puia sp.]|nr:N-acetyltransferase [Puia sp.]
MLKLSPFTIEDADQLISWFENEDSLVQFAGRIFTYPLTKEQIAIHLTDVNRFIYKAIDETSSLVIGHGEIAIVPNEPPKLTCLIIGDKKFRGKGLGKELTRQLMVLAFGLLQADAVQLYVYDWNKNAFELYKSLGFVVNPDKAMTTVVNGQSWVAINMVITGFPGRPYQMP